MQNSISQYASVEMGNWDNIPTTPANVPTETPRHALDAVRAHLLSLNVEVSDIGTSDMDYRDFVIFVADPARVTNWINSHWQASLFHAFMGVSQIGGLDGTVLLVRKNRALQNWAGAK